MMSHLLLEYMRSQDGCDSAGGSKLATPRRAAPLLKPASTISSYPQLEALFRLSPTESISANEVLFFDGDPVDFIFEIQSGCVRLQRIMSDGRRAIVTFLFGGEVMNAYAIDRHRFTGEAVTRLEIRRLSRVKLMSSLHQLPSLYDELLGLGRDYLITAMEHTIILARLNAQARIAAFLLSLAERFGRTAATSLSIDLPMNRLDVADFLGLTIESVSRALHHLKECEAISTVGTHRVIIHKPAALRALAGTYDY